MFKGIIYYLGTVVVFMQTGQCDDFILSVKAPELVKDEKNLVLGNSVACSGVCLTIIAIENDVISFKLSDETINITNFSSVSVGDMLNLECSVRFNECIDGHLVQGHIDCFAKIVSIENIKESNKLTCEIPMNVMNEVMPCIVKKGSIALEGISLTVNEVFLNRFSVCIIPYTWQNTNLHSKHIGSILNVETDMIARYLKNIVEYSNKIGM